MSQEIPFFQSSFADSEKRAGVGGGGVGATLQPMYPPPLSNQVVSIATGSFEDDPPILEELGINFDHITKKTMAVLNVFQRIEPDIMHDTDLAGPLVWCLLLGFFLLLTGKVHFGYIYGVGVIGCLSIFLVLNLMTENGIDIHKTVSVLGYCLLPMVSLAGLSVIFPLNGTFGFVFSGLIISWCTFSAASMFVSVLAMKEQTILVIYPVGLVYTCFALITIF